MKNKLRKKVLDDRFALAPEERKALSRAIEQRLFSLQEFEAAPVILFFASFQSEVDTHFMIRRALAEGKRIVLPKVKGKELVLLEIKNFDDDVLPGSWGIPEPERGTQVSLRDIGLIVVPGAVFDEQGNRIGYGGGYYDRLLPGYAGPTVALAYELQILRSVPADRHDIPVKKIVTEKRVIDIS